MSKRWQKGMPKTLKRGGKMKTQRPYEARNFIKDLESQNEIWNRTLRLPKGGETLPTLGFRCKYTKKQLTMEQQHEKKTGRGGARPGAGRKKKNIVKSYAFHAPQEVYDILEAVKGSKSEFICKCIIKAAQLPWAASSCQTFFSLFVAPSRQVMCASPPIRATIEPSQPPQTPINSHFLQENSLFTHTKKVHFPILYYNKSAFFIIKALACQNQSFVPPLLRVLSPLSVPPLVPPFPFFTLFPLFHYPPILPHSSHSLPINHPLSTLIPPSF